MVVMAHDKSPRHLDWVSGDVIERGRGYFPPAPGSATGDDDFRERGAGLERGLPTFSCKQTCPEPSHSVR